MILYIIILVIFFYFLSTETKENMSNGALIQLVAKGPQDSYLTGDYYPFEPKYSIYNPVYTSYYNQGTRYYPKYYIDPRYYYRFHPTYYY